MTVRVRGKTPCQVIESPVKAANRSALSARLKSVDHSPQTIAHPQTGAAHSAGRRKDNLALRLRGIRSDILGTMRRAGSYALLPDTHTKAVPVTLVFNSSPAWIRHFLYQECKTLVFELSDPDTVKQGLASAYGAIYADIKDQFGKQNGSVPFALLQRLGTVAAEIGMECEEKKQAEGNYLSPKGIGANVFASLITQKFLLKNPQLISEYTEYITKLADQVIPPMLHQAAQDLMLEFSVPPSAFRLQLQKVVAQWQAENNSFSPMETTHL